MTAPPKYTYQQQTAILSEGRDICVAAGAGSGKTGVLVERYLRLITQSKEGLLAPELSAGVESILVITFTEKATREMKERIIHELNTRQLQEERRKIEVAYISTIHGFCARLLQENPFEVGIDPHFQVMEEGRSRRILHQVVEGVVADALERNDADIVRLATAARQQRGEEQGGLLAALASNVESILSSLRTAGWRYEQIVELYQLGEAETARRGYTTAWDLLAPLISEIQASLDDLRQIQKALKGMAAIACEELIAVGSRLQHNIGTIQEAINDIMMFKNACKKVRPTSDGLQAEMNLLQIAGRIRAKCDTYSALLTNQHNKEAEAIEFCHQMWKLAAEVWKAYDFEKSAIGVLDNDDLMTEAVRLLEDHKEVRENYRRRLRYLMVDEFQDTNPLQMRLLESLHQTFPTPTNPQNYLFVVGDVQQSIYAFRGAEPSLFQDLERRFRVEEEGHHVPLAVNFRSRPEILKLVQTVYQQVWRDAETPFVPLETGAEFAESPFPVIEILVTQDLFRRDYLQVETAALAKRIQEMVEGEYFRITRKDDPRFGQPIRYRDVAVLLRQMTDSSLYEEAFARQGVPGYVVGGGRGYYARQEIRDLLNVLIVLDTPLNDIALLAVLRSPMVGSSLDTLYQLSLTAQAMIDQNAKPKEKNVPLYFAIPKLLASDTLPKEEAEKIHGIIKVLNALRNQEDRLPVGHLLERLIAQTGYDARLLCRTGGRRRLANVRKLLQIANSDSTTGVRGFIQRLKDMSRLSEREGDAPIEEEASDVVRFFTMHKAKGLEFPVIVLADLSRPIEHDIQSLFLCDPTRLAMGCRLTGSPDITYTAIAEMKRRQNLQESERLLYVAMTRAKERLILCGNINRSKKLNWARMLFEIIGVQAVPPQQEDTTLIGGIPATLAPLTQYYQPQNDLELLPSGYLHNEARLDEIAEELAESLGKD